MSIATKAPPYEAAEIDKIARALVEHKAHGAFYAEKETAVCFKGPLSVWSPAALLDALEKGMIYIAGFLPEGRVFSPLQGLPRVESFMWFDAAHTRKLLERACELEALVNLDLTKLGKKGQREIDNTIALFETLRRKEMPNLRHYIGKAIKGS